MKHALLCSALLLIGCTAQSAISPPAFDKAAMDSLLSTAVDSGEVIGVSALVFDEGHTVYTGAFGERDRERELSVEMDTVFRIYSMTKPITSAIIMDLQEEGLLKLSDPAAKYIPELATMMVVSKGDDGKPAYAPQAAPMTLEDLMLHRAGMGYGIFGESNPVEAAYSKAGLFKPGEDLSVKMTKLSKLPLLAQPGEGWYYSYSIDVLARIAEIVTGQRLGEIMDERIFTPLGMSETSFQVSADQKPRFATNYHKLKDGSFVVAEDGQTSPFLNDNAYQSGGGGLVSTLGDYARFAQMMLDGGIYNGHRVLDEATVKMMMANQMDADDKFLMPQLRESSDVGFGYGGRVVLSATPEALSKTGMGTGQWSWGGAARTTFWIDPANDAFGIMMLQFSGQKSPDIHDRFQAMVYPQTLDIETLDIE